MIEQTVAPPILGISGKFSRPQCEIGHALNGDGRTQPPLQRRFVPGHNGLVGFRDIPRRTRIGDFQNQRIVKTARPLENRSATAAASKDGDIFSLAAIEINFLIYSTGVSNDGEVDGRLPEPQDFIFMTPFAHLQQRLVASEIMLRK